MSLHKTMDSLTKLERELDRQVDRLAKTTSKKTSLAVLDEMLGSVKVEQEKLPTGETVISKVKRPLAILVNTIVGLADGINDGIPRSSYKEAVARMRTKFMPMFKEGLDALDQKVASTRSRLNKHGLLHNPADIMDELEKLRADLSRFARTLKSESKRTYDQAQLGRMLQTRIDTVKVFYGQLPSTPSLNKLAQTLIETYQTLVRVQKAVAANRLKETHGREIALIDSMDLVDAQKNLHRLIVNNLFTHTVGEGKPDGDEVPRKSIAAILKVKKDVEEEPVAPRAANAHLKDRIASIKKQRSKLPVKITGAFELLRAPVVAIFSTSDGGRNKTDRPESSGTVSHNFTKTALLDQYGIKYQMIEDYLIMEDQQLLAFSRKDVEKAAASLRTKRTKKEETSLLYAKQVLDLINSRGSRKYSLVSNTAQANPRNSDILLFWVMPANVLDVLIRRGWNKLATWNLPFDI